MFKAVLVGGPKNGSTYMLDRTPERIKVPSHSLKLAAEFAAVIGEELSETEAMGSVTYERDPVISGFGGPIRYFWVPKGEQDDG